MNSKFQTYQLTIKLLQEIEIQIGRLGKFVFPAGDYIYTGSAKTNFDARIERHYSKSKKIKWHIDFLLANEYSKIVKVEKYDKPECEVNQTTKGRILVPKFGASDCKSGCGSHLKYLG